jgi:excisionase family DNA binding protein
MYRVNEVADMLGVSPDTVLRWFRGRAVAGPGRRRRTMLISRRDLEQWVAEHRAAG